MLKSCLENGFLGMKKETYLQMCEDLGSEPIESEIPVEFEDLPAEAQTALVIYNKLKDTWDYMNGNYTGKDFSLLKDFLGLYEVPLEDYRVTYDMILYIDSIRSAYLKTKKKSDTGRESPQ